MASISAVKGRKIIQFYDGDKNRRTIRLGKVTLTDAREVARHVERLNAANKSNTQVRDETLTWLAGLPTVMREKLYAVCLIERPQEIEPETETERDPEPQSPALGKPKTLAGLADANTLNRLQSDLLAGVESKRRRPRSPHTVRSCMASIIASLNWAKKSHWLPSVPEITLISVSKLKRMKGRPIVTEEFERLLDATNVIVGQDAAGSWIYLLRGLWTSALRLGELMHVSWDDRNSICPEWPKRRLPVLHIPAALQKNDSEDSIPLLPWFETVLMATPLNDRTGWVFRPGSLQSKYKRKPRHGRPTVEWVGKIITRIGEKANVVVCPANDRTGKPVKFASAHDLRRSCLERLRDAGVPMDIVTRVARHANSETTEKYYAPGKVQSAAETLRAILDVPRYNREGESTQVEYPLQDSNLRPSV